MNKMIKQTILPFILALLMVSCNEEAERFTLENPADQMKITASSEKVVLLRSEEAEDAITFSWGKAADRGPDVEMVYQIRLGHAEMKDLKGELIRLDDETFSMTWTVQELNNMLNAWGIAPGVEVPMEAELFATVVKSPKYLKPEISTTTFSLVGYDSSNRLFLALLSGDQQLNLQMETVEEGIYNWKGELTNGEFWFASSLEQGSPTYMKGDTESSLVYSSTGAGTRFNVEGLGIYDITVDLNSLEVSIDVTYRLFIAILTGDQQQNHEMEVLGDGIYTWGGLLTNSEFWFVINNEDGFPTYMKGDTESSLVYSNTGEGARFILDGYSHYDITVDLNTLEVSIDVTPIQDLFLVTSFNGVETVTPLADVELGQDVFYMKGDFEAGTEFRFVRDENVLWPAFGMGADATTLELKTEGGEMFTVSETASYVMTVNMKDLSLIFLDVFNLPTGRIAVVGGAVSGVGWDAGVALMNSELFQKDLINHPEVWSYTGDFTYSGDGDASSFKFVGNGSWGDGFFAQTAGANPFEESQQGVTVEGDGDRKWQLPSNTTQGVYTLELNLHTMKINFFKVN